MVTKKRGLILAAVAAGIAVAAVAAVPLLVNSHAVAELVIQEVAESTGRDLVLSGPLSASLLPSPRLRARDARLSNPAGASQPEMMRVAELEVKLRWWPLLTGRVDVASLVLKSPRIDLERLPDGRANWDFAKPKPAALPPPAPSALPGTATPSLPATLPSSAPADHARLTTVEVENGIVTFRGTDGPVWRLEAVHGLLSADSDDGPFHVEGEARLNGLPLRLDGSLGRLGTPPAPLSVRLDVADAAALRFNGSIAGSALKGMLTVKADDLSRLSVPLGLGGAWPAVPLVLEAPLTADARQVSVEELSVLLNGAQGGGHVQVDMGAHSQVDVKVAFTRLDLDGMLARASSRPALPNIVSEPLPPPPSSPAATPAAAPAPPPSPPPAFALPKNLGVTLDLSSEAVVWRDGLLRGAHINAELSHGDVTLNQASISLPGGSDINLFGYLAAEHGKPSFDGSFEASTDEMRSLLDWLKLDVTGIAPDRLRAARLAGKVKGEPGHLRLDGGQLKLDGAVVDLAADLRLGERPALGATFATEAVNLDAYWPKKAAPAAAPAPAPSDGVPGPGHSPPPPAVVAAKAPTPSWLTGVDANLHGHLGQLQAHGLTARDVQLDASWMNGVLVLKDFSSVDLAGGQVKLSGGIEGLAQGTPRLRGLHWDLRSKQPAKMLQEAGLSLPIDAEHLGPVVLSGSLDGTPDALSLVSAGEAAGVSLHVNGKLDGGLAAPRLDLLVEASHSSFPQVARLFAPGYQPAGLLGGFAVSAHLTADPAAMHLADVRLTAGPLTAAGEISATLAARPRIEAKLSTNDFPIDPFLAGPRHADARPRLRDMINQGLLIPTNGVPTRRFPAAQGPEPAAPAAAPRPAVAVGALADGEGTPFDLGWMRLFDAQVTLDASAITKGHIRYEHPSLAVTLTDGTATLDRFSAQLWGGHLTGNGHLSAEGQAAGQVALAGAHAHEAVLSLAELDLAEGVLDGDAHLTAAGQTTGQMLSKLSGGGRLQVKDGVVRGFDLKAVDQKLQTIDGPAGLLGLLQAGVSGGATRFSGLGGTFRLDRGVLTSDDLKLVADGGGAEGAVSANLPGNAIDAHAQFHLASAANAPPLVMRLTGALDHPRRFIDINAIQTWLVQRGVDKMKGKGEAGRFLQKLLGQKNADPPADPATASPAPADPAAPPEKVKAKDILNGLLRGLH